MLDESISERGHTANGRKIEDRVKSFLTKNSIRGSHRSGTEVSQPGSRRSSAGDARPSLEAGHYRFSLDSLFQTLHLLGPSVVEVRPEASLAGSEPDAGKGERRLRLPRSGHDLREMRARARGRTANGLNEAG